MSKHVSPPLLRQRSTQLARELLQKVRDVAVDADAILQRAGLPSSMDALLRPEWTAPLSPDQFTLIYRECVAARKKHDSRRQARPPRTKGEVDMPCYCIINCATLADEGVSMQQLKERCPHDLAIDLLADDGLSLDDIAPRIGFSDAATFSRGFQAWAGIAPSAYRNGLPSFA